MIPVILSGGSGSRLWPLSRKQFPKQFLALTGEHTLFQQTLERLVFEGMDSPIVVCNKDHRFIVNEQLANRKLECQRILMEPFGRNDPSGNRLRLHQVHQRFAAARRREPRTAVRGKTR